MKVKFTNTEMVAIRIPSQRAHAAPEKDTETGRETDYATDPVYPYPGTGARSYPVVRALDVGGGSLDDASEALQPPETSTDDEQRPGKDCSPGSRTLRSWLTALAPLCIDFCL
jgi:hypothetical protein